MKYDEITNKDPRGHFDNRIKAINHVHDTLLQRLRELQAQKKIEVSSKVVFSTMTNRGLFTTLDFTSDGFEYDVLIPKGSSITGSVTKLVNNINKTNKRILELKKQREEYYSAHPIRSR